MDIQSIETEAEAEDSNLIRKRRFHNNTRFLFTVVFQTQILKSAFDARVSSVLSAARSREA